MLHAVQLLHRRTLCVCVCCAPTHSITPILLMHQQQQNTTHTYTHTYMHSQVKQPALVRDMLRAARGVTGVFAAAAPSHDPSVSEAGLLLPPQSELPLLPGVRVLLHELGELGLMYRHVQAAVTRGAAAPRGTVHQALCGALAEQVTDYYRLLALLEDQLSAPLPVPGMATSLPICLLGCPSVCLLAGRPAGLT
jgi:hypothetical protein